MKEFVRDGLVLTAFTTLALALRLVGNGLESIWFDEAVSLILATTNEPIDLSVWRQHDVGNPAGYFLILRGWFLLWGDQTVETARSLSALAGAIGVPATWLLARAVNAPRRAGWLACLLVAVSPPLVYLGQEARVFALFATLVTLTAAAAAWIQRTDRPAAWLAFAGAGAILVHLHYYAAFVLVALGLALLVWAWPRRWRPVFKLASAAAVVALAFLPWLPSFRWQMSQGATRAAESAWQHLALLPPSSLIGQTLVWREDGPGAVAAVGLFAILFVYLPVLWLLGRGRVWSPVLFALVVGVPLLISALAVAGLPMIHYRYLSALYPALMLVLAWGLDAGLTRRSWLTVLPLAGLVVLMTPALARVYLVRHKPDWRGVAAHIGQDRSDLRVYLYEDHGTSEPFAYYRPGQPYRLIGVPFGDTGVKWSGLRDEMQRAPDGFWLVLFLTTSETRSELPRIVSWAHRYWQVEIDDSSRPITVLRCKPLPAP